VNDAVDWYEEQSRGLGEDFYLKLKDALEQIRARPAGFAFRLSSKTIRRLKLKRFSYDVLYEMQLGRVRVLCVRHEKRPPRFGVGRS